MSFLKAMALWLDVEGGYKLTNPPEGPTYAGILKPYYDTWCAAHGRQPVWVPTNEGVGSYLHDAYWTPFKCDELPEPADSVAMQMVGNLPLTGQVRAGPIHPAKQILQVALGVFPDGEIGPVTLAAVKMWHPFDLADRILLGQETHYTDVRSIDDPSFKGLLNRIETVKEAMALGKI